jgi:long-chain acyl-CoA synthetase
VHLSPLDGEIALSHKLTDSGARIARHQQSVGAAADRAEVSRQGPARPADRLRGRRLGRDRHAADALPNNPAIITYRQFVDGVHQAGRLAAHRRR